MENQAELIYLQGLTGSNCEKFKSTSYHLYTRISGLHLAGLSVAYLPEQCTGEAQVIFLQEGLWLLNFSQLLPVRSHKYQNFANVFTIYPQIFTSSRESPKFYKSSYNLILYLLTPKLLFMSLLLS